MEKRDGRLLVIVVSFVLLVSIAIFIGRLTGDVVGGEFAGIPEEEQECMTNCVSVGCGVGDSECMTANSEKCISQCEAGPSAQGEGEQCVQDCIDRTCVVGPKYADCMDSHRDECDEECGMNGDALDESEMDAEQLCISNCVAEDDPSVICGNSKEGETGNVLCQRCANECVHLYEGPCLNDEQLTEKERECETCEHCYGSPIEGPSGQGWDCIVNVECKDASGEFGDESGTGPGIGDEGYVPENVVEEALNGFIGFFKGLFGGRD